MTDQSAARTTIRRFGSTPSDSLSTPEIALTTSWTHLRSNADIGSRRTGSPCSLTFSTALRATAPSSLRRVGGEAPMLGSRGPGGAPLGEKGTGGGGPGGPPGGAPEAARGAHLAEDGQAGELLERLQGGAALADERLQATADDLDHRAAARDQLVDVAVVVQDVEQALDVVGRYLALAEQVAVGRHPLGLLRLLGVGVVLRRRGVEVVILDGLLGVGSAGVRHGLNSVIARPDLRGPLFPSLPP